MSFMPHGIRVLSKQGTILTFKTYLIYYGAEELPRTHGFALQLLMDRPGSFPLKQDIEEKDYEEEENHINNSFKVAQHYIKSLEVDNFENFPLSDKFLNKDWHGFNKDSGKFHAEEYLPGAVYTLEVKDARWIEHLQPGDVWETKSYNIDGLTYYLELKDDTSRKFYRATRRAVDVWRFTYGRIGSEGTENVQRINAESALKKVNEKLAKGYTLVYKNFETDYSFEDKVLAPMRQARREKSGQADIDAMFKAVGDKDVETVRQLLEKGVDPNTCLDKYKTAVLEKASKNWRDVTDKDIAISRLLLEHGANPNTGQYGPMFLSICYMPQREEMIHLFMEFGVDITLSRDTDGHTVLQSACTSGLTWLVKECIAKGMDVNAVSKNGHTPMHDAASAEKNAIEIIDLLLEAGATLDFDKSRRTPMSMAAWKGTPETIEYLFRLGLDINAQEKDGFIPVHYSLRSGSIESLETMIRLGADINRPDYRGRSTMQVVTDIVLNFSEEATALALEKIKFLMNKGYTLYPEGNPEPIAPEFLKSLKKPAKLKPFETNAIFKMLEYGLDPYETEEKGFSLLHLAAKMNTTAMLAKCLEKTGNINLTDEFGWTPLHYAAFHKNRDLVKLLRDKGIDETIQAKKKRTYAKAKIPAGATAAEIAAMIGNEAVLL
ncbi:ankyrin repeat domain-containing protein [Flavobacterium sp. DGU11]|uniref:Ankyrin repeat domain-containing protein n=1 Tax=Flavobacterium arundinis TaxID=3139143 RepID=A0ABU9HSR3_9FLAO